MEEKILGAITEELPFQNTSSRRLKGLESLQEFIQAATQELMWLNEKEEIEVTRDWSSRHLNVPTVEEFYKVHNSSIKVVIIIILPECRSLL